MPHRITEGNTPYPVFSTNYVQPVLFQQLLSTSPFAGMVDLAWITPIATLSLCNITAAPVTVKVYIFHAVGGAYGAGTTDEGHVADVIVPANSSYDLTPMFGGLTLNDDEVLTLGASVGNAVVATCSYTRISYTDALPD